MKLLQIYLADEEIGIFVPFIVYIHRIRDAIWQIRIAPESRGAGGQFFIWRMEYEVYRVHGQSSSMICSGGHISFIMSRASVLPFSAAEASKS